MESVDVIVSSTASDVLSYAAAFFFVVVAIAIAYALLKTGKTLGRVDTILADVDKEALPLLQKAGVTLDEVNANLSNVDSITEDVAGITDKLDAMANAVEGAVSTPARKAAAFGAGVQSAFSSFMSRGGDGRQGEAAADAAETAAAAAFETAAADAAAAAEADTAAPAATGPTIS
jgi:uncharacterized protein YoxC